MNRDPLASGVTTDLLDVLIVGAGWSGMYMLHRCRELGLRARVLEAAPSVGGAWYWNRYPGLRCDVESYEYSYSFDQSLQREWVWSERFPSQPEILAYANHVADRYDLRRDIEFEARVNAACLRDDECVWEVTASRIGTRRARFLVMATGALSIPKKTDIPGLDDFGGTLIHTADWPSEPVDFTGKRVGVIGTGSTGVQVIPVIAETARQLHVFQRTPSYSVPAHNRPLTEEDRTRTLERYDEIRHIQRTSAIGTLAKPVAKSAFDLDDAARRELYDAKYGKGLAFELMVAFEDMLINEEANRTAQEYLASRIRERVKDPAVADILIPKEQFVGTRRICLDTGYYETYNRDNVTLKDVVRDPIRRITREGVELASGHIDLDTLVLATGFDAMTGALLAMDIRGTGGVRLRERWSQGPRSLLGLAIHGFPNLFTITGPGSPAVFSNMFVSIEQHVEWIADCLAFMQQHGHSRIEAGEAAQEAWVGHVSEVANATLFPRDKHSWYLGANVPGKPRVFMPYVAGVGVYREYCTNVAKQGYPGFEFA